MDGAFFLPEFDHEVSNTRRMLKAVSDEHLDYRPHEKSWTTRELATHVATVFSWTKPTFDLDGIDLDQPWDPPRPEDAASIIEVFEANASTAREALGAASSETLSEMWTLRTGDAVHFSMPKAAVFRSFVMNHLIHHRGQLAVHLRACGCTVPGMYGPSADEMM